MLGCASHLGWYMEMVAIILVEEHEGTIPNELGCNWLKSFLQEDFQVEFPIGSYVKLNLAVWSSWLVGRDAGHNFGRGPYRDHSTKVWLLLAQYFQTRRFSSEFRNGYPLAQHSHIYL